MTDYQASQVFRTSSLFEFIEHLHFSHSFYLGLEIFRQIVEIRIILAAQRLQLLDAWKLVDPAEGVFLISSVFVEVFAAEAILGELVIFREVLQDWDIRAESKYSAHPIINIIRALAAFRPPKPPHIDANLLSFIYLKIQKLINPVHRLGLEHPSCPFPHVLAEQNFYFFVF